MNLDDMLLDRYGEYYCSEYVAKNQPWLLQMPFHEWVERQMALRMKRMDSMELSFNEDLLEPFGTVELSETA